MKWQIFEQSIFILGHLQSAMSLNFCLDSLVIYQKFFITQRSFDSCFKKKEWVNDLIKCTTAGFVIEWKEFMQIK